MNDAHHMYGHGGNISQIARRFQVKRDSILDFSANINPLGLPDHVKKTVAEGIEDIIHYPDPENCLLTEAISSRFGLSEDSILCGNGSNQLLYILMGCLKPKKVLLCVPGYAEYEKACIAAGAQVSCLACKPEQAFRPDLGLLDQKAGPVDLLLICNPHNPTGIHLDETQMDAIVKICRRNKTFLMVDEAFADFTDSLSLAAMAAAEKNMAVLKSMTKFFAIPGLRLGFVAANRDLVLRLKRMQPDWSVNCLAQKAGVAFLQDSAYIRRSIAYIRKQKDTLFRDLKTISGIKPFYPSANFILIRLLKEGLKAKGIWDYCIRKHGIVVRDCTNFEGLGNKYIRVAVRRKHENDRLLKALRSYCGS